MLWQALDALEEAEADAGVLRTLAAQCEATWPQPGRTAAEIVTCEIGALRELVSFVTEQKQSATARAEEAERRLAKHIAQERAMAAMNANRRAKKTDGEGGHI